VHGDRAGGSFSPRDFCSVAGFCLIVWRKRRVGLLLDLEHNNPGRDSIVRQQSKKKLWDTTEEMCYNIIITISAVNSAAVESPCCARDGAWGQQDTVN